MIEVVTGTFKSFDGTSIYYEVRGKTGGNRRPIIFNYGIGCLMNHWHPQVTEFSKTHQVITYDYRGHHKSETPLDMSSLNIDSLAQDLLGLMDHLNIETASLWGHSFGTQVIARFAKFAPERIANVVSVNGFLRNPLTGMFGNDLAEKIFKFLRAGNEKLPFTMGELWKLVVTNPLAAQVSGLLGGFNLKLTALKDVEIYGRGLASMNLKVFLTLFESMLAYDGRDDSSKIKTPVLIFVGGKDAVTPESHQMELKEFMPQAEVVKVAMGSHCTHLDMPDLVNLRIEKFFRENNY